MAVIGLDEEKLWYEMQRIKTHNVRSLEVRYDTNKHERREERIVITI